MNDHDPSNPRVRDLPVTVKEIYSQLHFKLGSIEKVLEKYPELTRDDIAAVEAHVRARIRTRTHDDYTGRSILPKALLKHGAYYKGRCRNATIARRNAEEERFYHWREKFGRIYIETIMYPTDENEPWWDIFFVVEELQSSKFEIPFDLDAAFDGDPAVVYEFEAEMWEHSKTQNKDLKQRDND
jgi:uncharacterized protein (DUF433 family)